MQDWKRIGVGGDTEAGRVVKISRFAKTGVARDHPLQILQLRRWQGCT